MKINSKVQKLLKKIPSLFGYKVGQLEFGCSGRFSNIPPALHKHDISCCAV